MSRDGMWNVTIAIAWLRQHEWGEVYVLMLVHDTAPGNRLDRWLTIVTDKYADMHGDLPILVRAGSRWRRPARTLLFIGDEDEY